MLIMQSAVSVYCRVIKHMDFIPGLPSKRIIFIEVSRHVGLVTSANHGFMEIIF